MDDRTLHLDYPWFAHRQWGDTPVLVPDSARYEDMQAPRPAKQRFQFLYPITTLAADAAQTAVGAWCIIACACPRAAAGTSSWHHCPPGYDD